MVTLVPGTVVQQIADGRPSASAVAGVCLIVADVTNVQHSTIVADARVQYLPLENASNVPLLPSDLVTQIPAGKRLTARNMCEGHHIPLQHLGGESLIKHVISTIKKRFIVRRALGPDDLTEPLSSLISEMNQVRRQTIRTQLQSKGISFENIALDDTVESALVRVMAQTDRLLITRED
jgi:hypothetical protein